MNTSFRFIILYIYVTNKTLLCSNYSQYKQRQDFFKLLRYECLENK